MRSYRYDGCMYGMYGRQGVMSCQVTVRSTIKVGMLVSVTVSVRLYVDVGQRRRSNIGYKLCMRVWFDNDDEGV